MRASETASDASPGTTASQTGVPTQVVQQTQGTPQVGTGHHAPAPLPPPATLTSSFPSAAPGPDKHTGQAGPCVPAAAHQPPSAPAGRPGHSHPSLGHPKSSGTELKGTTFGWLVGLTDPLDISSQQSALLPGNGGWQVWGPFTTLNPFSCPGAPHAAAGCAERNPWQ